MLREMQHDPASRAARPAFGRDHRIAADRPHAAPLQPGRDARRQVLLRPPRHRHSVATPAVVKEPSANGLHLGPLPSRAMAASGRRGTAVGPAPPPLLDPTLGAPTCPAPGGDAVQCRPSSASRHVSVRRRCRRLRYDAAVSAARRAFARRRDHRRTAPDGAAWPIWLRRSGSKKRRWYAIGLSALLGAVRRQQLVTALRAAGRCTVRQRGPHVDDRSGPPGRRARSTVRPAARCRSTHPPAAGRRPPGDASSDRRGALPRQVLRQARSPTRRQRRARAPGSSRSTPAIELPRLDRLRRAADTTCDERARQRGEPSRPRDRCAAAWCDPMRGARRRDRRLGWARTASRPPSDRCPTTTPPTRRQRGRRRAWAAAEAGARAWSAGADGPRSPSASAAGRPVAQAATNMATRPRLNTASAIGTDVRQRRSRLIGRRRRARRGSTPRPPGRTRAALAARRRRRRRRCRRRATMRHCRRGPRGRSPVPRIAERRARRRPSAARPWRCTTAAAAPPTRTAPREAQAATHRDRRPDPDFTPVPPSRRKATMAG